MSSIKAYRVACEDFESSEVTLQVDHGVLTPALATEINNFWSGADGRLSDENGDVVRAVVRLFGVCAIQYFMQHGGVCASASEEVSRIWTAEVIKAQHEGWPGLEELGILITSADVYVVGFEDAWLEVL